MRANDECLANVSTRWISVGWQISLGCTPQKKIPWLCSTKFPNSIDNLFEFYNFDRVDPEHSAKLRGTSTAVCACTREWPKRIICWIPCAHTNCHYSTCDKPFLKVFDIVKLFHYKYSVSTYVSSSCIWMHLPLHSHNIYTSSFDASTKIYFAV